MNKLVAITIGDIKGIGIQILIDCWKKNRIKNFILFSDIKIINKYFKNENLIKKTNLIDLNKKNFNLKLNKINIYSYNSKSIEDNTYKSLNYAYKFCKKNICIGIITLPLRKDIIKKKLDKNFIGHTEFFQKIDKKKYSNMILYHQKIIVSPLTTHIKLKDIPKVISDKEFLYNQLLNLNNTLKHDFNIQNPKILISGLNPHAGENGELGIEEKKFINPVINRLKKIGLNISGPLSADGMLININLKKYDIFVFMYHDQALIPYKYISQFSGVNYTGNLDIIRTSPDHGTAYNLINKKSISNKSFINCFKLINKIFNNRKINAKSKKIS